MNELIPSGRKREEISRIFSLSPSDISVLDVNKLKKNSGIQSGIVHACRCISLGERTDDNIATAVCCCVTNVTVVQKRRKKKKKESKKEERRNREREGNGRRRKRKKDTLLSVVEFLERQKFTKRRG